VKTRATFASYKLYTPEGNSPTRMFVLNWKFEEPLKILQDMNT